MATLLWALGIAIGACIAIPVLYLAYRSVGRSQHWRLRPGLRRLTTDAAMEQFPSIDRDGRRLAFEAIPEHRWEVRVRDLGKGVTGPDRVLPGPGIHARRPRLSADGRHVAYESILARHPARSSRLVVHDLAEGVDHVLGSGFDHVVAAALSGDASRVLVCGAAGGIRKVHLHEGLRDPGRPLVPGDSEETCPAFSADGRRAAFLSSAAAHPRRRFAPVVVDLDDGGVLQVADSRDARALSMSADGRVLAWEAAGDGPVAIRVLDVDVRRVATIGPGFDPVVSADGRFVAFDTAGDLHDLEAVDLASGRRAVLDRHDPYPYRASFAPAGARLLFGSGRYNPLSRTGDTDVFAVDLLDPRLSWRPAPVDWEPASVSAGPLPVRSGAPDPVPVPRNSMWCAAFYFRPDGTMKPLAEQDRDGIEVYSERLARTVDRVRALTGSPVVNVVCHCMGGLAMKGALQYWHDGEHGFRGADGAPTHGKVRHFVTLASPLRGNSFLGVLPLVRALRIPYYRLGFTRQAYDMTRHSAFLARLNCGERWHDRRLRDVGACYKPAGRDAPPFHRSFTCDSYVVMDGAVTLWASRCPGLPGSATHLPLDEFGLMHEAPDGRCSFEGGRKMVHVPEDVVGNYVVEDKCRAIADWIATRLEPDVPVLFVHGSYLFRGLPELSWRLVMRRLSGETVDGPGGRVRVDVSPDGAAEPWLLDAGCD